MPTQLTRADHLDGLRTAMLAFVRNADRAGMAPPVPTCPDWTVRDLVAHQGMVHRWATAVLTGATGAEAQGRTEADEAAGRAQSDPTEWLADGAIELAHALTGAGDGVNPDLVFLVDAPSDPVDFWARRQCHETTIHAVDALSAALGRPPRATETWIDADIAVDGIDELLTGNITRPISRLRLDEPALLLVTPDDTDRWWLVELGDHPPRTTTGVGQSPGDRADWVLTGTAVELYLQLWNRSPAPALTDPRLGWQRTAVVWRRR